MCLLLEALELTDGEEVLIALLTLLVTELPLSLWPMMELSSEELRVEATSSEKMFG